MKCRVCFSVTNHFVCQVTLEATTGWDIHSYISVDDIKFTGCSKYDSYNVFTTMIFFNLQTGKALYNVVHLSY